MFEKKLISAVRRKPEVYNRRFPGFRKPAVKEKAWETISKEVGMSTEHCKGRWRTLRDRFTRDFKKKIISGAASSPESHKWKFYDDMLFLGDCIVPKRTETNFDGRQLVEFIEVPAPPSEAFSQSSIPSSGKRSPSSKQKPEDKFLEVMIKLMDLLERKMDREEKDVDDQFDTFLGSMIKKLDIRQQGNLKIEILNYAHRRVNEILST